MHDICKAPTRGWPAARLHSGKDARPCGQCPQGNGLASQWCLVNTKKKASAFSLLWIVFDRQTDGTVQEARGQAGGKTRTIWYNGGHTRANGSTPNQLISHSYTTEGYLTSTDELNKQGKIKKKSVVTTWVRTTISRFNLQLIVSRF